jgi:hypothetical protein
MGGTPPACDACVLSAGHWADAVQTPNELAEGGDGTRPLRHTSGKGLACPDHPDMVTGYSGTVWGRSWTLNLSLPLATFARGTSVSQHGEL